MIESIEKYFLGELTSVQKEELFRQISGNPNIRDEFVRMQNSWALAVSSGSANDRRRALRYLREFKKRQYRKKALTLFIGLLKYAAILIVGMLMAWGILHKPQVGEIHAAAYQTLTVPAGQRSHLLLADGSSVWLNSGSSLQIPVHFGTRQRQLFLDGEACFEVPSGGKMPLVVLTANLQIRVHGTSFNVTSYSSDPADEVALLYGSLSVANTENDNEILLKPGQKISYARSEHRFTDPVEADRETETAWRDGKLIFENLPFGEIAKKLERRYGVTIRIENPNIEQIRYRGAFRRESVEQAIRAIQFTTNYHYKIEEDTVTIY